MAKTLEQNAAEVQVREAEAKPTLAELAKRIRDRPGHKPYTGPSSAAFIRAERDSH